MVAFAYGGDLLYASGDNSFWKLAVFIADTVWVVYRLDLPPLFQRKEGAIGDRSELFSFVTFFPESMK